MNISSHLVQSIYINVANIYRPPTSQNRRSISRVLQIDTFSEKIRLPSKDKELEKVVFLYRTFVSFIQFFYLVNISHTHFGMNWLRSFI